MRSTNYLSAALICVALASPGFAQIDYYDFESDTIGAAPAGVVDDSVGVGSITVMGDPAGGTNNVGAFFADGYSDRGYISRPFPEQTGPFVASWDMYLDSSDYLAADRTTAGATVGLNDAYGGHLANSWTGPYVDFQYYEDGSQDDDDAGDGLVRLQFFGAGSAFVELDKSMTVELSDIDFAAETQTISVYQDGESRGSFPGVGFRNNGLPYDSGVPNAEVFEFRTTGAGGGTMYLDNFSISPVPEPTSLGLFGTGCVAIAGFCWIRRRRQRAAAV